MNRPAHHPTHLWISDPQTLQAEIITLIQRKLCAHQACQQCVTCRQIKDKEHPWVIWLTPERSYSLDQIDEILHTASFKLDQGEYRFFILQQAERLTDHCSNRLLKTVEEPFEGYNFFFLTDRPEMLPLTIQSRCVVKKFQSQVDDTYKNLLHPFFTLQFNDPINFIKQVDSLDIKEQESRKLTDDLYSYWATELKRDLHNQDIQEHKAQGMINVLQWAIKNPAMTGGSKIFWKNLYLSADYATKTKKALD